MKMNKKVYYEGKKVKVGVRDSMEARKKDRELEYYMEQNLK